MDNSNQAASAKPLMLALQEQLQTVLADARSHRDDLAAQRNRLLSDLPPSSGASVTGVDKPVSGSVSFGDIGALISEIRSVQSDASDHIHALRVIG